MTKKTVFTSIKITYSVGCVRVRERKRSIQIKAKWKKVLLCRIETLFFFGSRKMIKNIYKNDESLKLTSSSKQYVRSCVSILTSASTYRLWTTNKAKQPQILFDRGNFFKTKNRKKLVMEKSREKRRSNSIFVNNRRCRKNRTNNTLYKICNTFANDFRFVWNSCPICSCVTSISAIRLPFQCD